MQRKRRAKHYLILIFFLFLLTVLGAELFLLYQKNVPAPSAPAGILPVQTLSTSSGNDVSGDIGNSQTAISPDNEADTSSGNAGGLEPACENRSIRLMAVGDNLMHMGVVYSGKQEDGSLNYEALYDGISNFLSLADIKIINQETIMGGNQLGFSGYPHFNSPTEVGDALCAVGFNVVLQASNHTADQGVEGMENCIAYWNRHPEVLMTGLHEKETEPENHRIPILEIDSVRFAVLNYTYGPNMGTIPASMQGYLDILCAYDSSTGAIDFTSLNPQVLSDIAEARKLADIVIVCPHWGTEYQTSPSSYQKKFAQQMADAGADVIIGTHPHVVQPVEWLTGADGHRTLCYYSLGNYVSTQKDPISMLEAMAWVSFDVTKTSVSVSVEDSGVVPLVCHYSSGPVRIKRIYPLSEYTAELAASHGIRNYGKAPLSLSDLEQWSHDILGSYVIDPESLEESLPEH